MFRILNSTQTTLPAETLDKIINSIFKASESDCPLKFINKLMLLNYPKEIVDIFKYSLIVKKLVDGKMAAAEACGKIGEPALGILTTLAGDEDTYVRMTVAETCGKIGEPALKLLTTLVGDIHPSVRKAAAESCGQIGVPALEILTTLTGDKDTDVKMTAAEACGQPALGILTLAGDKVAYVAQQQYHVGK